MNQLSINTQQTMSSREIADLVESRHDHVKTSIERLYKSGVIQRPPMRDVKNDKGQTVSIYEINKRDSYVVVAQLSPEFTGKLVDRWQELENQQPKMPTTFEEALRLAADTQEALEKAQLKIESDKPKVDFALAVRNMQGACSVGDFAKTIGVGRNKLFKKLRDDCILMRNNVPYQKYLDLGLFVVIEQIPYTDSSGKTHPAFTTMISGKGQVFLEKKYREQLNQE